MSTIAHPARQKSFAPAIPVDALRCKVVASKLKASEPLQRTVAELIFGIGDEWPLVSTRNVGEAR